MAEQYIINGSVDFGDNHNRRGLKVQAFDRDLPSLERRAGGMPTRLGEAFTDAEGNFQLVYTSEQLVKGEGATSADVTFRVLDAAGAELAIRGVRAREREYRGDEVIFNVPNPFRVALKVEGARPDGGSEYEQLVAVVSPFVAPLQLTEIAEDDIAFLSSELDYNAQGASWQRLEWLRRSGLLAVQSSAPVEAFYGWGRKGLPAELSELVGTSLEQLPKIREKLSSLPADLLRETLLAAIGENIISGAFRDRVGAIASALHRNSQQTFLLRLRLQSASSKDPLPGYSVGTIDVDRNAADLGTDVTDSQGQFIVEYFDDRDDGRVERNLRFRVRAPEANDPIEVTQRVKPADGVIAIDIPIGNAERTLQKLKETALLEVPDDLVQTLQNNYGIKSLVDIRRRGGLHRISATRQLNLPALQRLDALADLDRLCKDVGEATALIDRKFDSVLAISDATRARFVAAITTEGSPITPERATELHIAAKAQTDLLDQMFAGIAHDIAVGMRPRSGVAPDEYSPLPQEQDHV